MALQDSAVARAQMLIRKPIGEVFEAFVDPAVTTRFWFTKSSGRLAPGADVRWEWEMYGVSAKVSVKEIEPNRRILIEWGEPPCPVEWSFSPRADGSTFVTSLIGGRLYAVVNVNTFTNLDRSRLRKTVTSFDGETLESRLDRRSRTWIENVTVTGGG
jgi:uncharacterized protein YndB with AHSA1/START domain